LHNNAGIIPPNHLRKALELKMPETRNPDISAVVETPKARNKGGRRKGSVALKKDARERLLGRLDIMTVTPLEVMYLTMKDFWDRDEKIAACAVARDLAPYVHPKLTAIQQQIVTSEPKEIADEQVFDKLLHALEIGVRMRENVSTGKTRSTVVAQQTSLVETIEDEPDR
jgi:hypothetical protein